MSYKTNVLNPLTLEGVDVLWITVLNVYAIKIIPVGPEAEKHNFAWIQHSTVWISLNYVNTVNSQKIRQL